MVRDKRMEALVILLFLWLLLRAHLCFAGPISSLELINNAKKYDGELIQYKGEVIGDIMVRGEYAWLNVNDGQNAIGVWIKKESTKDIIYTGSYRARGDIVEVIGKFNRSCVEHGGDLDIHAQPLIKVEAGRNIPHPLNRRAITSAAVLSCAVLLVSLLTIHRTKKKTHPSRS